jgi:hypothetical protein
MKDHAGVHRSAFTVHGSPFNGSPFGVRRSAFGVCRFIEEKTHVQRKFSSHWH